MLKLLVIDSPTMQLAKIKSEDEVQDEISHLERLLRLSQLK